MCVVDLGDMRGCSRGCEWLLPGEGGMCGCSEGGAWFLPGGACMVALGRGACVGYDERRRYGQ